MRWVVLRGDPAERTGAEFRDQVLRNQTLGLDAGLRTLVGGVDLFEEREGFRKCQVGAQAPLPELDRGEPVRGGFCAWRQG